MIGLASKTRKLVDVRFEAGGFVREVLTEAHENSKEGLPDSENPALRETLDGYTTVMSAAGWGQSEVLKKLLKMGGGVNAVTKRERKTALHFSAENDNPECAYHLLESGADKDAKTRDGYTALMLASRAGHIETVKVLVEGGASVNAVLPEDGATAIMFAIQEGHDDIVKYLCRDGEADVNQRMTSGYTPLMIAASYNRSKSLHQLMKAGANKLLTLEDGFSTLMVAAGEGHVGIIRDLVKTYKFDVNAAMTDGYTALMAAAARGWGRAVKELVALGAEVDYKMGGGQTALHVAATGGDPGALRALVESGASLEMQRSDTGHTPLMAAVLEGRVGTVAELLALGADADYCISFSGDSALNYACKMNNLEIGSLLLEKRANPNRYGRNTAGCCLSLVEDPEFLALLIEKGAKRGILGTCQSFLEFKEL